MSEKILVTGAFGQIGTELVEALQKKYGRDNIIALGHRRIPADFAGVLEKGSTEDKEFIKSLIKKHRLTQIYHLVSILSVTGEKNPHFS